MIFFDQIYHTEKKTEQQHSKTILHTDFKTMTRTKTFFETIWANKNNKYKKLRYLLIYSRGTSTRRQRRDLFHPRVKLPPDTTCLPRFLHFHFNAER